MSAGLPVFASQKVWRQSVSSYAADLAISVKSEPYAAQGDGTTSDDAAFTTWFAALLASGSPGYIPKGRYKFTNQVVWDFASSVAAAGIKIFGAGMFETVLDVTSVASSPQFLMKVSGGSLGAPAELNYASFTDFAVSGNINGIALQIGSTTAVDAFDSCFFGNIWASNSNTGHSNTAAGTQYNNVVCCTFQNMVNDCGVTTLTKTVAGSAAAPVTGAVRLQLNNTTSLVTNMTTTVAGVGGTTEANGTWSIIVVDGTHIDLVGSTWANAWTSGGTTTSFLGFGDAAQIRMASFCNFSGSFGAANIGLHFTGGLSYSNVFHAPDVEIVNNGVLIDSVCGPNNIISGQWAVTGGGFLASNSQSGNTGYLILDNINNGVQATNLYAANGQALDQTNYYLIQFRGYYGDGPQTITVGASPFTWINKTGQTQQVTSTGGTVSKIEYQGPNSGSVFANTNITAGTVTVPPTAALRWTHTGAPTTFVVPQI